MKQRMMAIGLGAALAGALLWGGSAPIVAASGPTTTAPASQVNGPEAVKTALAYVGIRYAAGGTLPGTGFDDVGFVQWVYAQQGITLPSDLTAMRAMARQIGATGLHPGHLIFFKNTIHSGLSHVGIWIGKGQFVHAEWYDDGVTVSWLKSDPKDGSYWATHYLGRSTLSNVPTGSGSPHVGDTVVVTIPILNVHTQPLLSAPIVGVVHVGERFTVAEKHDGWILLSFGGAGSIGWAVTKYTSAVL
jgi:hypothetical protein